MKLFFTIFGAILAAAVVVWAAMAWSKSVDRDRERTRSASLRYAKLAKIFKDLVYENGGKIPVGYTWDKASLREPEYFAAIISRPWPSEGEGMWSVRDDFFSSYRSAIAIAKAGGDPRSVAWADEMAKRLAEAEDRLNGKIKP